MKREEARQRIKELKDEIDQLEVFAHPFMLTDVLGGKNFIIESVPGGTELTIYYKTTNDWYTFVLNPEQLSELITELQSYESN
jgi:hypothetical protein